MRDPGENVTERIGFLRRRFMPYRRMFRGPLALVPLLNVVLLLAMFAVLNSAFVMRPGVVVHLPSSPFVSGTQYSALVVTVTQEGLVFFNDERTTLDGLQASFAQMAFEHPDMPLVVEADSRVPHSTIVRIYNMAMGVGIRKVLLATRVATAGGAR